MTVALELDSVTVALDGVDVLATPLTLGLERGEHVALVGRSGCGKSTLLRAVAGLVPLASGSIRLGGVAASEGARLLLRPEQRRIGYLPQGGALWPHLSVAQTLELVLSCGGVARADRRRRASRLLELVELGGYEHRRPPTLSGGEAQRVALARALALEPSLLLLDEPLGPLDAELRSALLSRLEDLRRELGFSALHVTHDPREVAALAHRTLRLDAAGLSELDPNPQTEHTES